MVFTFEITRRNDPKTSGYVMIQAQSFNHSGEATLSGDSEICGLFLGFISTTLGPFGNTIMWPKPSPADVYHALIVSGKWYENATMIEGEIEKYSTLLPPDVQP
jgi:hypothetical protein